MSTPRILLSTFGACAVFLLTASINSGDSANALSAQDAARWGIPSPARGCRTRHRR